MQTKWKIFIITFFSYALIHGSRTAWSSLKYTMNSPPYSFSPVFLGTLDMLVLVVLAIALTFFGPKVVSGGPKEYLRKGMVALSVVVITLGLLVYFTVTHEFFYALVYPLVGLFSVVGWPACIYILSLYFQKGIAFSLWNGCIQFGDFTAILLSFVFVQAIQVNAGVFLFMMAGALFFVGILVKSFLSEVQTRQTEPLPQASPAEKYADNLTQEKDVPSTDKNEENNEIRPKKRINFLTVWTLPGVSGYILSFIFVKTVYAIISTWLVFYLAMIHMVKQAHIIALLWSASTFGGGILGIKINKRFEKKYFIVSLFVAAIFFVFLEEMHLYPNELEIIVLVSGCGIAFGGPYTIMNSSIPLYLSQKPAAKLIPGAKAAIISAMEGYSILFCGITIIFVPTVGVFNLHWVACVYCIIAALILSRESYKDLEEKIEADVQDRKYSSEPAVKDLSQKFDTELSANTEQARKGKKKRRTRKTASKSANSRDDISNTEKGSEPSERSSPQKRKEMEKDEKRSEPLFPSKDMKDELIDLERDKNEQNPKKGESQENFFEQVQLEHPYVSNDGNQYEYNEMNEAQDEFNVE